MATANITPYFDDITDLPFVNDDSGEKRCFWDAKYTGSSDEDYAIGEMYAKSAIRYIKETNSMFLINWTMRDMPKNLTRLEHAFFNTLAIYAAKGL